MSKFRELVQKLMRLEHATGYLKEISRAQLVGRCWLLTVSVASVTVMLGLRSVTTDVLGQCCVCSKCYCDVGFTKRNY